MPKGHRKRVRRIEAHLAMMPGLDLADAKRITLAICALAPVLDLPEFYQPDAAERLAGIPDDLPRPSRYWINSIYIRQVGLVGDDRQDDQGTLTDAQRVDAVIRYQFTRYMVATLAGRFDGCPSSLDQCRELLAWIGRGDTMREFIIGHDARLAWFVVKQFRTRRISMADKLTAALQGLMFALDRYDPRRNAFSTYAFKCIRGFILKALKDAHKHDWSVNDSDLTTGREEPGILAMQVAPDRPGPEVHELLDLHRALAEPGLLNAEERYIIRRRFGVAGVGQSTSDAGTLEEVGEELGVTRERVRQVEVMALEKLRCRVLNERLPHTPAEIVAQARRRRRDQKRDQKRGSIRV